MVDKYVDEIKLDKSKSCLNLSFVELLFQTSVIETSRILSSYITMYYNTNTYKNSVVCNESYDIHDLLWYLFLKLEETFLDIFMNVMTRLNTNHRELFIYVLEIEEK